MAKTKNGFVPPKGKPSGSGKETAGLRDAFAVNDLEKDMEIADKYSDDPEDRVGNVRMRHVNRNVNKGEEDNESKRKI